MTKASPSGGHRLSAPRCDGARAQKKVRATLVGRPSVSSFWDVRDGSDVPSLLMTLRRANGDRSTRLPPGRALLRGSRSPLQRWSRAARQKRWIEARSCCHVSHASGANSTSSISEYSPGFDRIYLHGCAQLPLHLVEGRKGVLGRCARTVAPRAAPIAPLQASVRSGTRRRLDKCLSLGYTVNVALSCPAPPM